MNLSDLKDTHRGERCFILGNGPSLNKTRLSELKDEFTIGLNRIYLKFPDMGFATDVICCVNELVLQQFGSEILIQPGLKFVNEKSQGFLQQRQDVAFITSLDGVGFQTDLSGGSWYSGSTVTYCAMQLAFHMGFSEVVILGVDHNFVQSGRAHQESKSSGADTNHFHPDYFGKNVVWQFPDLVDSEISYTIAREVFRISGREIVDGTVGGKLTVFRKVPGYGEASDDQLDSNPRPQAVLLGAEAVSKRRQIYEFLLNSKLRKLFPRIGFSLCLISGIGILYYIYMNLFLLPLILLFLVFVSGLSLALVSVASDWMSDWSRRRRNKDGQGLIQILSLMK